jgi:hypothetical protein
VSNTRRSLQFDSCRSAAASWTVVYSHEFALKMIDCSEFGFLTHSRRRPNLPLKMASYNTLPVAANPEEVLLQKPKKTSLRYLVGGAALAAFLLGAVAATAVTSQPSRAPAALSSKQCPQGGSTGYSLWCPAQDQCRRREPHHRQQLPRQLPRLPDSAVEPARPRHLRPLPAIRRSVRRPRPRRAGSLRR